MTIQLSSAQDRVMSSFELWQFSVQALYASVLVNLGIVMRHSLHVCVCVYVCVQQAGPGDNFQFCEPADLVRFGLLPEFVGRFPVLVSACVRMCFANAYSLHSVTP